jgi:hypothetical protein
LLQTTEKPAAAIDQKTPWKERANAELEKIVALFSSKQLPDLCAKALISAPEKPSSKWSLGNQLLMLMAGTSDARGFRQWNDVGRWVGMDMKAIWILGPVRKKVKQEPLEKEDAQGQEKEVLIGFKAIPVFRYEDTCGQELPVYEPRNPPPLMDVAEKFGMNVQYARLGPGMYGATDHTNKTIVLASEDWDVFFHELAHAIHRSFEPKNGHGQEPEAETIAQLVAATLARLYGRPADSFSWSYISMYAQSNNPQKVGRLCLRVLDRAKKVLELVYSVPDHPPTT